MSSEAAESEYGYENTFLIGKAMALTALDLIEQPNVLDSIKSEFETALSKRQSNN